MDIKVKTEAKIEEPKVKVEKAEVKVKEPETKVEAPEVKAEAPVEASSDLSEAERAPCNWNLTLENATTVNAVCIPTGRRFTGTTKEFSAFLRG